MKLRHATLLILAFSIALTPVLAEVTRPQRGTRHDPPGLRRLQRMGYSGPVAPKAAPAAARGGNTTLYVAAPPLGSNTNDGLTAATPFATIQFAFLQAISGDEIRVLPGTYRECINNTAFALSVQKNLNVVADDWVVNGNRSTTILDGQTLTGSPVCVNPFSVVNLAGFGSGSRLEGFTVTNAAASGVFVLGSAVVTNNIIANNTGEDGGGVFVYPGTCYYGTSTIEVSNNQINDNTADDFGECNPGGTACSDDNDCGINEVCEIFGGNGGGVYVRGRAVNAGGSGGCLGGEATVAITNNVIDNNGADFAFGGGLYAGTNAETGRSAAVTITNNLISNNATLPFSIGYGGGAWIGTNGFGQERIDFVNNAVTNNSTTADGGGLSVWLDMEDRGIHTVTVSDNDIDSNTADGAGGGMDLFQFALNGITGRGDLDVDNNRIRDNEALGINLGTFSPGVGGGAVLNAWSEETSLPDNGIEFFENEVSGNTAALAGGAIGVIVRADSDHDNDGDVSLAGSKSTLKNNLIVRNDATGGLTVDSVFLPARGGGIFAFAQAEGGVNASFPAEARIELNFNTIAENTADTGSGGIELESYTIVDFNGNNGDTYIDVDHSIVYDNSGFGVGGPPVTTLPLITVAEWTGFADTGRLTLINDYNSLFMNTGGDYQSPLIAAPGAADQFEDPLLDFAFLPETCSPTVDAGTIDPFAYGPPPGLEPAPNGGKFNLGHTGGLATATTTLADANGDGIVDGLDLLRLSVAFATFCAPDLPNPCIPGPRYDASVDFDEDNFVGPVDLSIMGANFTLSCP